MVKPNDENYPIGSVKGLQFLPSEGACANLPNLVISAKETMLLGSVPCGNVELDSLAEILCEARRGVMSGSPRLDTVEALNVALDIVGGMKEGYRRKITNV